MIDAQLADAMADRRLTPLQRNVLTTLHRWLDYHDYYPVKVQSVSRANACARSKAFESLARLEHLHYIVAAPTPRKPKHYRLAVPRPALSPATGTSWAA